MADNVKCQLTSANKSMGEVLTTKGRWGHSILISEE